MEFNWKKKDESSFDCEIGSFVLEVYKMGGDWISSVYRNRNSMGLTQGMAAARSTSEEKAKKDAEDLYLEMIAPFLREGARREAGVISRMLSDAIRAHKAMADEDRIDRDNYIAHDAAADALESARSMIVHLGSSEEVTDQRLISYSALRLEMDESLMTENHLQRLRAMAGVARVEDLSGSGLMIVSGKELADLHEKIVVRAKKIAEEPK